MKLKDQVAWITGGAQGIGKAVALRLAGEGAHLILTDVDAAKVQATAAEIAQQKGIKTWGVQANVVQFTECEKLVGDALDKFGRIDILINNAGITKDNLLMRMSDEEWDAVLAVNLKGVFNCTKAVVRPMMKQRQGRIVNVASVVGLMGNAGQANYAASKGGVVALTKTCAREFASRNILVNAVAPGFIRTRMTDALTEDQKKKLLELIPLARLGEAEDVAKVVLFLCTEDSSYITGHVVSVNGGMYI
ncbi:MAG: 3-oxoacyl-[acyl-carrier-protein] reductase [Elusimicrobia bacterium RIFCSPLOWO2_01_FULL_59_12]|nr:MAG: 3-oxoacyl-[acyl-carrier-protein] reductase [Elusimicrobia bacterium RIFCSPLOWO2_01_FULL_59_12]